MEVLEERTLLNAGYLDTTFGTGGMVITPFSPDLSAWATASVVRPDGKIVAVGVADVSYTPVQAEFALAWYDMPDGHISGHLTTPLNDEAWDSTVALQGDKILVAGTTLVNYQPAAFGLVRYKANFTPDPAFGGNGTVTTPFVGGPMGSPSPWTTGGGMPASVVLPCGPMAPSWRWEMLDPGTTTTP
jgi:hypothetical protein